MKPLKQTDLQEVRREQGIQKQLPNDVESMGTALVKERIARLQSDKKMAEMGQQLVDLKLSILSK
ncbi:hypothetical protein MKZ02_19390 [Pseudobacillus sp. FSL P4-0506]|uniref:hypothetical protein n=1 Tax=Pseudobacillus sp. FSL P4-0506 TaxID=2921576 RepID=UPI0030F82C85